MESQLQQLDHKNMLTDMKNAHQDSEIQMLKTLMTKIISKEGTNKELVTDPAREDNNDNRMKLRKRPASLLPPSYFSKYNNF